MNILIKTAARKVPVKTLVAVLISLGAYLHQAQADDYLDDRSTAGSLIRSLYNAINLQQYGRAYDYFSDAPAKDYATYAKGFDDTAHVDVLIGQVGGDGAAGSIYYNTPVAIRSKSKDGKLSYFAGCYVVRAINVEQEPPYRALQVQEAKLKPIKADDYQAYALPKCSDVPAADGEVPKDTVELTAKVKQQFVADASSQCDKAGDTLGGINEPEINTLTYRNTADDPKAASSKATLFKFVCSMAAYNETDIFYLANDVDGIRRLSFAEPLYDYTYSDADSAKLKSMKFKGFTSSGELINADFDPKTGKISSFAKWRGLGDASSAGSWAFSDGQFVLQSYDIDPTFDGEMNPISVIKNGLLISKP